LANFLLREASSANPLGNLPLTYLFMDRRPIPLLGSHQSPLPPCCVSLLRLDGFPKDFSSKRFPLVFKFLSQFTLFFVVDPVFFFLLP